MTYHTLRSVGQMASSGSCTAKTPGRPMRLDGGLSGDRCGKRDLPVFMRRLRWVVSYFVILSEAKDLADRKDEILRSLRSLRMTCSVKSRRYLPTSCAALTISSSFLTFPLQQYPIPGVFSSSRFLLTTSRGSALNYYGLRCVDPLAHPGFICRGAQTFQLIRQTPA